MKWLLSCLPWLWWVFSIVHEVAKNQPWLSNWAYTCIDSLGCISNSYILNCHLHFNKAGGKMLLKKALMYSNIFYKSTCKNDRMLIIFYRWALWEFIILSFLIFHACLKFSVLKMKTELKFVTPYFLVLALSEIIQSTIYITRLHLIYSPLKSLAEAGSLVTSLINLPQAILSSPYNYLRTIISISKLSDKLSPFSFCCLFYF